MTVADSCLIPTPAPAPLVTPPEVTIPDAEEADVCLLVEGTYPFVSGGVSSWVHDIILGHPQLKFAVLNVGSHPAAYGEPRFKLPDNVIGLHRVYCQESAPAPLDGAARAELREQIREVRATVDARTTPARVLSALHNMHLDAAVDRQVTAADVAETLERTLDDLAANDVTMPELLHSRASFDLLSAIADQVAPDAPFLDLFWHFRAMHVPVLRLLAAPRVPAACYHAVATGYAGLLAAVWSRRTGRPLVVTEHGIYAREREMELARADWIRDVGEGDELGMAQATWAPRISPLRRIWSRFFRSLARLAYAQARSIVTLSEVNRRKQLADGAPPEKIDIVPNGVDLRADVELPPGEAEGVIPLPAAKLRVGFVGRVVPIKDLVTFIRGCDIALRSVALDVRIIGPSDEDPDYAGRCKDLVDMLGRTEQIRFVGPMKPAEIYSNLDVVVLTSFSEGQPLVMLEAYACGVPVISTDVGACREMVEGRTEDDRRLGPSGFVTRVAQPKETAAALVKLAKDSRLRHRMGLSGRKRVTAYYQRRDMLAAYETLYAAMIREGRGAAANGQTSGGV